MAETTNIGELLKQKRQERNLSLREVATAISIRMNYLQAIEDGEIAKMLSQVYCQGFIRQYASFLGVDTEMLTRNCPELFMTPKTQDFSNSFGSLELDIRDNPSSRVKWLPNILWVGAFLLLLMVAWFFAKLVEVA